MSKLLKNSSIYIVMHFLQKSLSFFLLPLYTAFLTPSDYGIIGVVASIDSFLSMAFSLSLNSAVTRLYYKHIKDPDYVRKIWGSCVTITWIMVLALVPILTLFHRFVIDPFAKGIDFYPYLFLGILSTALNPLYMLFQRSLQARQEGGRFARNNIANFLFHTLLNIVLVAGFKMKALGMLLSSGITGLVFFLISLRYFLPQVQLGIDRKAAKESLAYALPLLPHGFAARLNGTFDRLMMNNIVSTASVGIYNVGNNLAGVITTLATAVNQAFSPWFFQKADSGEDLNKRTRKVAYFLTDTYIILALGLSIFGYEVITILTNASYLPVLESLPIQAFAAAFTGIYFVASNSLFLNNTKAVPFITLSTAALNIALNLLLIPLLNVRGAALAGLATQFAQSLITMIVAIKGKAMQLNPFRVYGFAFFAMAAGGFSWALKPTAFGLMSRLAIYGAFLAAYILTHYASIKQVLKNRSAAKKTGGTDPASIKRNG